MPSVRFGALGMTAVCALILVGCGDATSTSSPVGADNVQVRDLSSLKLPADRPRDEILAPPTEDRVYDVDTLSARETYAAYYGYVGPWFSQLQWDRGSVVLSQSVSTTKVGSWSAHLLVRNDSLEDAGTITVEARLSNARGETIDTAVGTSLLTNVRPGEPVPVEIRSRISASEVSAVDFSTSIDGPSSGALRQIAVTQLRTWPYGDRGRISLPGMDETGKSPYPYTTLIYLDNVTDESLDDMSLWVGWINSSGELLAVTSAKRVAADQTVAQASSGGDFVAIIDDPLLAEHLESSTQVFWAEGQR